MSMNEQHESIRLLLADDHDILREGVRRILAGVRGITVVGEASSGEEAIKVARELQPDIVLMDVQMPGIGGMEAANRLSRVSPSTKILVLTAFDDEPFPSRMMQAGCSGYLTKNSSPEEMEHAIRIVYSGNRYISPSVAQQLAMRHVNKGAAKASTDIPFDQLSERELQVLMMIASNKNVQEIADILHISPKTVNSYRYRLFTKLGVKGDVALARLAFSYGVVDLATPGLGSATVPTTFGLENMDDLEEGDGGNSVS